MSRDFGASFRLIEPNRRFRLIRVQVEVRIAQEVLVRQFHKGLQGDVGKAVEVIERHVERELSTRFIVGDYRHGASIYRWELECNDVEHHVGDAVFVLAKPCWSANSAPRIRVRSGLEAFQIVHRQCLDITSSATWSVAIDGRPPHCLASAKESHAKSRPKMKIGVVQVILHQSLAGSWTQLAMSAGVLPPQRISKVG